MKKQSKTEFHNEDARQVIWELWFISSFIIVLCFIFVGTLENSLTFLPNWLPFFILSIINFLTSIYYGTRK